MRKTFLIIASAVISFQLFAQERDAAGNGNQHSGQLEITIQPHVIPAPTFSQKNATSTAKADIPRLAVVSSSPNEIIDYEEWFSKNELSLPVFEVSNPFTGTTGNVPSNIPSSYNGLILVNAIKGDEHNFFIYGQGFSGGRYLLITDSARTKALHLIDFDSYSVSPEIVEKDRMFVHQALRWAQVKDDILYVSHGHSTYSASSKGMNAYITAIRLSDYSVIWRSAPLVCNALNFEIYKDAIICGYGFTAEPDFLFTLNRYTGSVVQKLPIKSGPDYIIRKGLQLFVRTYNTDYIFKIQ